MTNLNHGRGLWIDYLETKSIIIIIAYYICKYLYIVMSLISICIVIE